MSVPIQIKCWSCEELKEQNAKLEAEAQAHREEVAALRARVVVPDALLSTLRTEFPLFDEIGLDEKEHCCEWSILHERKRLHRNLDELARLNGKAVSEGLLRRLYRDWCKATDTADIANDMEELGALLGEGKES